MGDFGVAQEASDACQRLQMIGAGAFGREQQKNQIDRLTVERLEIDRPVEPREQPEQPLQLGELAMRDGDTVADAGRAELLALHENLEDRALVLTGQLRGLGGELLQGLLLAVNPQRRNDGIVRDVADVEIAEAELTYVPNTTVEVTDAATAGKIMRLMDALEVLDDVTTTHVNFDISEELLNV